MDHFNEQGAGGKGTDSGQTKKHSRPSARKMITIGIIVIIVICVAVLVYAETQSKNIKVGTIVQATITGNPAMITTAFIGLRAEDALNLTKQDQANLQSCDIPGAAGILHSGWASNGGVNWADQMDASLCASASRFPFDQTTCSTASDCYIMHHMPCGVTAQGWNPTNVGTDAQGVVGYPWDAQCGYSSFTSGGGDRTSYCSFSDATSNTGFCALTPSEQTDVSCMSGKCHWAAGTAAQSGWAGSFSTGACPFALCTGPSAGVSGSASTGQCYDGQICSYTDGQTLTGYCVGDPLPHVMLNTPILVEGTVTAAGTDGTFDVFWDHAQVLYNVQGPAKGWNYQNCVVTPSTDPINQQARSILFGQGGTWAEGMTVADPQGFTAEIAKGTTKYMMTWQPSMQWMQQIDAVAPAKNVMVEPAATQSVFSAWNLQSQNVPATSLMRVLVHGVTPTAPTAAVLASWGSQVNIAKTNWIANHAASGDAWS